ncbi:MAG: hypothetical protein ABSH51_24985 [Solirubrobacteraceae bacterium]
MPRLSSSFVVRRTSAPASAPRAGALLRWLAAAVACIGIGAGALAGSASAGAGARTVQARSARAAKAARVPAHIATWAFDDACNGGGTASASLVRTWLSYAEADCGPTSSKARADCHAGRTHFCDVMQYLDTDWDLAQQPPIIADSASESWWLHAPRTGQRIFSPSAGGGYLDDQAIPAVRTFYTAFARRYYNSDDGLLMDWQSPSLSQELYYSNCGCAKTAEIHSDIALRRAHQAMAAALTRRNGSRFIQADNTLPPNPYTAQGLGMLNRSLGVDAWVVEGEPESFGTLDPYYSTLLDQIAYIATRTHGFIVPMSRAVAGASYATQTRQVQEGTMLLGFSPGHIVDWADFEQGSSNLAVWPEESIYPTGPVESMAKPGGRGCLAGTGTVCTRGGHTSVQVAPGVYRREFRACYLKRIAFGPCATIVNTTGGWVTVRSSWLKRRYRSQITLVGGDVQSGGSVDLGGASFRAGSTAVAPQDAILLSH